MSDPCRVTADLAAHEADERRASMDWEPFDEHDDKHVAEVVGKDLAKGIQDLLLTLRAVGQAQVWGGLNVEKAAQEYTEAAKKIRSVCRDRWRDL